MPLEAIRRFFEQRIAGPGSDAANAESHAATDPHHGVKLAACALLLELAHADDEFSAEERDHLHDVLTRHFALEPEEADDLMRLADAERREAVDLYQFTSLITQRYDEGQRMVLAEIMWRVVYADGRLSQHESYLMRKLSNLLELRPGYLAEARQRAIGHD